MVAEVDETAAVMTHHVVPRAAVSSSRAAAVGVPGVAVALHLLPTIARPAPGQPLCPQGEDLRRPPGRTTTGLVSYIGYFNHLTVSWQG